MTYLTGARYMLTSHCFYGEVDEIQAQIVVRSSSVQALKTSSGIIAERQIMFSQKDLLQGRQGTSL
jgi:hypothetical protein